MSITIGYFFNSEKALTELGQLIGEWLGCSLAPYEDDETDLCGRFLGMAVSLGNTQAVTHSGRSRDMAEDRGVDWFLRSEAQIMRLKELHACLQQVSDPSRELPDLMRELGQVMDEAGADRTPPPPTPETREELLRLLEQRYEGTPRSELIGKAVQAQFRELEVMGVKDERLTDVQEKLLTHLHRRQEARKQEARKEDNENQK